MEQTAHVSRNGWSQEETELLWKEIRSALRAGIAGENTSRLKCQARICCTNVANGLLDIVVEYVPRP